MIRRPPRPLRLGRRALAERIRGSRLVVWPDEGHLATVTHVEEVLRGPAPA